jgi:hypothetical protein
MRRFALMVVTTVCLLELVGAFTRPPQAFAQAPLNTTHSTTVPPAEYEAAVDLAFEEFEAGNYAEARTRFLQAYELFPNARVLRALAKTEYELKNYVAAITFLEQSLAATVRPLTVAQRADAQQLLEQARGYVARYRILTVPEQTTLRVDGLETRLAADGTLLLIVGEHAIEARATGYQPTRLTLQVLGRTDETVRLELSPLGSEPGAITDQTNVLAPRETSSLKHTPLRKKWWVWTGVAAIAAASVVTGVMLSRREPSAERPAPNSGVSIPVQQTLVTTP